MSIDSGRGATDAVFIALGTGVGGAIVANGKLHRGKRGTGGELGHMILWNDDGGLASSDDDTLEGYVSGKALEGHFRRAGGSDTWTGYAIGEAARNGDPIALHAVRSLGHYLGCGCGSLANTLDTERFVIGGGLSDLGDLILEPARNVFAEHVLPLYADTEIVPAALGTHSSVVGAACVALAGLERDTVD